MFAHVALDLPVPREFTYAVPDSLMAAVRAGMRVKVPFARQTMIGIVTATATTTDVPAGKLKSVIGLLDQEPLLSPALLELGRVVAREFCCAVGEALAAFLPAAVKRRTASATVPVLIPARSPESLRETAQLLEEEHPKRARVLRCVLEHGSPISIHELTRRTGLSESPVRTLVKAGHLRWSRVLPAEREFLIGDDGEAAVTHALTKDQERVVAEVLPSVDRREHAVFLLHGVTGSGKTEVYLQILERVRKLGRGAIVLVPEISLTPQTVGRFARRFPEIAVLHSGLSDAERGQQWRRLLRGEARVAVGARSALFAPVLDLGLIVVDEEHESTFKQQNVPRYHVREVAVARGQLERAVVVLGSATPSIESFGRAQKGVWRLLSLPARVGGGSLPEVRVIDMRNEQRVAGRPPLLSRALTALLEDRLQARDQAILFLNRRGFVPVLWCGSCGQAVRCPRCSVAMTLHLRSGRLLCHYCMEETPRPELCPVCRKSALAELGFGTEKVQQEVQRRFAQAVVARMDADTMRTRADYEKTLRAFRERRIDVLVGTQMIAKGLDFPSVTVVGVLQAEGGLFQPDFRAEERTFQLIAQVAGRAGRGARPGTVILQTLCPDNEVIRLAAAGDFKGFVARQLLRRQEAGYPPFSRLLRLLVEGKDDAATESLARELRGQLVDAAASRFQVLGPARAPVARIKERWRWHLLVKCPDPAAFQLARGAAAGLESRSDGKARVLVDVDPISML
jgi:primosomal protein N' (replication factor Y)